MERVIIVVKKWWVLALVLTLALSLTSCSKKRNNGLLVQDQVACDGGLGEFNLFLLPAQGQVGMYDIFVVPYSVVPLDLVTIAIGQDTGDFAFPHQVLVKETTVQPDVEIYAGRISQGQLAQFDRFIIAQVFAGTTTFHDNYRQAQQQFRTAVCVLPLPGGTVASPSF